MVRYLNDGSWTIAEDADNSHVVELHGDGMDRLHAMMVGDPGDKKARVSVWGDFRLPCNSTESQRLEKCVSTQDRESLSISAPFGNAPAGLTRQCQAAGLSRSPDTSDWAQDRV